MRSSSSARDWSRRLAQFVLVFVICSAGLGSGIGVLLLRLFGLNSAEQLVGASGCVMGLVGVWAGLLLRHRHAPMAGRRLKNILVIVAIQTAFDLSTPQISMAAHMSGLVEWPGAGIDSRAAHVFRVIDL